MATAVFLDDGTGRFMLFTQIGEFLTRQFRVDAVVVFSVVVFIFVVIVIALLFCGQFRTHMRCCWRDLFFCIRINETGDQIRQTCFARFNAVILLEQIGNSFRVFGNGTLDLVDTIFNTFGDVDYPEAITYLLEQYDRVEAGEARLSDLITGFVDPNAEEDMAPTATHIGSELTTEELASDDDDDDEDDEDSS